MAAGQWLVHNKAMEKLLRATLDLDSHTFVARLYTSASDVHTLANNDASTATNELGTANGYTAGGTPVTLTVTETTGTSKVDFSTIQWTASGSGIVARYCAVVSTTATPDEILCSVVLDATPADVTAPSGTLFTVANPTGGAFTLARV